MKKIYFVLFILLFVILIPFEGRTQKQKINIIPLPANVTMLKGYYNPGTEVNIMTNNADSLNFESHYLADVLKKYGGIDVKIIPFQHVKNYKHTILLELKPEKFQSKESYKLKAGRDGVFISAKSPTGIFYGIQSFLQLLPVTFYDGLSKNNKLRIPACFIEDKPRFSYRGMHLDVSRHFFPPAAVKQYIDMLAMYKFNTFHWHLTDDQGWRIEIKKYPKLTQVGAWRDSTLIGRFRSKPERYDHSRYGGFYTQAQIRDIVKYAAQRHINIIPEIEMPGHSSAAVAAYPWLACSPGPFHVAATWGIFRDIYCPKDTTFGFLKTVLTEVMALFPSEYIHIGGDEVPKAQWKNSKLCQNIIKKENLKNESQLQSLFIQRIDTFLTQNGRKMIGWDEILEGGLPPGATVMSWRGEKGGIEAARQGHDAIMAPQRYTYFDHYQADRKFQPIAIGGFTTLKKVYSYEPVPVELDSAEAIHILGAEGCVWTEYIPDIKKVQYMALPRMAALAEVDWTTAGRKNWSSFQKRINYQFDLYKTFGYSYCKGSYKVYIVEKKYNSKYVEVVLHSEIYHPDIRYTTDGTTPTYKSEKYKKPFLIPKGTIIKAAIFVNDKLMETPTIREIK